MKKFTYTLGTKILACFLIFFFGITAAVSSIGIYYARENHFYSDFATPYHNSALCKENVYHSSSLLIDLLNYGNWGYGEQELFSSETSNFRYTLKTKDDTILLDNRQEGESLCFIEDNSFQIYEDSALFQQIPAEYDTDSPPKYKDIIVSGYIIDPPIYPDKFWDSYQLHQGIYDIHAMLLPAFCISGLLFATCFLYLLCAAGHRKDTDKIVLNLQDKIPLDLYLFLVLLLGLSAAFICMDGIYFWSMEDMILLGLGVFFLSALALATILTCTTRLKCGRYFYQNTIFYRLFCLFAKGIRAFFSGLRSVPIVRRVALGWILLSLLYLYGGVIAGILSFILLFLFCISASQMQKLAEGGEALAKGDLKNKIDTQRMFSPFRKHGEHLNSVSKGFSIALKQKMKSEQMKTELITNVSHDIKTPLTSIINYVDLLKKENLEGQAADYIEVLDRQSHRLKKLTEDLVEASKASTGNLQVRLEPTDLGELVTQAIAEYEEKCKDAELEVLFQAPAPPLFAMADGTLTWRILSNLLNNVHKYAQHGTRVYIDITPQKEYHVISVKNISKTPLNIPVDELMERFVRGDDSRSTEGSGLGLHIAKSLATLQKGLLHLQIDGDLFKAELSLPATKPPQPPIEKETE